ncbi:MAG TPA: TRAP transporter small permease [Stellaceae bacterium]|nr:TRAP transporter small permease [Stellaceae bacterium]
MTQLQAAGERATPPSPVEPGDGVGLRLALRRAMDALYWLSAGIASVTLVLIAVIIPWGVYTRYVRDSAASWPEPAAILLSIVLTFFGAAACYRADIHMRITVVRGLLPLPLQRAMAVVAELLVAAVSIFMIVWGIGLCQTTWHQSIDEFPWLRVGITYMPIPIGGVLTTLFVIERLLIGPPRGEAPSQHRPGVE